MKFESYALFMRAVVYHMNYLEVRKQSDQVLKSLGSLDLNMNGTPDLNMFYCTKIPS